MPATIAAIIATTADRIGFDRRTKASVSPVLVDWDKFPMTNGKACCVLLLQALLWPLSAVAGGPFPGVVPYPAPRPAEFSAPVPTDAADSPSCARLLASGRVQSAIEPVLNPVPEGCSIADPIRLRSVLLPGGGIVAIQPPAVTRCAFASALADWVRTDVSGLLPQGETLVRIEIAGAYQCRGRNQTIDAKLSEHATGNAIDITAFITGHGKRYEISRQSGELSFFAALQASACKAFMTVLGPGSDGMHETHLHLDLQERRNGSHYCRWTVNK